MKRCRIRSHSARSRTVRESSRSVSKRNLEFPRTSLTSTLSDRRTPGPDLLAVGPGGVVGSDFRVRARGPVPDTRNREPTGPQSTCQCEGLGPRIAPAAPIPDRGGLARRRTAAWASPTRQTGGSEGLAMLNRTNRTLSANPNRLNLGTRKLDGNASANIGSLTLRTAHVGHVVVSVRAGSVMDPGFRFEGPPIMAPKPMKPAIPAISGSSPESSWPRLGRASRDLQGQPAALASQPVGASVVRSGDGGTGCRVQPPRSSSWQRLSRSSLGRRCDSAIPAGRSARAIEVSAAAS